MGRESGYVLHLSLMMVSLALMSFDSIYVQAAVTLPPPSMPRLVRQYYKKLNTCENVENFVKHQVKVFWDADKSITPRLVKLLYADCMPNGCDGSILLDGPDTEKSAAANKGLATGVYVLIDKIKSVVEQYCPGAVSCADILVLAARDALSYAGAPSYPVLLGRKDGFESKASWVDYPSPSSSWESTLKYFQSKGLDTKDMTTLLGAHTMGKTHCNYIQDRLYNFNNTNKPDPSMSKSLHDDLINKCAPKSGGPRNPTVELNPQNPGPNYKFTNTYYTRVIAGNSVLGVDQQLKNANMNGNVSYQIVDEYSRIFEKFRRGFALSVNRMAAYNVLTGNKGEIRKNCRARNY